MKSKVIIFLSLVVWIGMLFLIVYFTDLPEYIDYILGGFCCLAAIITAYVFDEIIFKTKE